MCDTDIELTYDTDIACDTILTRYVDNFFKIKKKSNRNSKTYKIPGWHTSMVNNLEDIMKKDQIEYKLQK